MRRTERHRRSWSFDSLTNAQWLELSIGAFGHPGKDGFNCVHGCRPPFKRHDGACDESYFPSDADRRQAWWSCRDVLMGGKVGFRPWGWWKYEGGRADERPVRPRSHDEQRRILDEMGKLSAAEKAQLRADDRMEERNK